MLADRLRPHSGSGRVSAKKPLTETSAERKAGGMDVTPEDRKILDAIIAELRDPATTPERKEDLADAHQWYAEKYCYDWLLESANFKRVSCNHETSSLTELSSRTT